MPISTAALIRRGDQVLFVRRPEGGDLSLCWELPGGKVDAGEQPQTALQRELREELGLSATIGEQVGASRFQHRGVEFDLLAFSVDADLSPLRLAEHIDLCWVSIRDALNLELAPSDRRLIERMLASS